MLSAGRIIRNASCVVVFYGIFFFLAICVIRVANTQSLPRNKKHADTSDSDHRSPLRIRKARSVRANVADGPYDGCCAVSDTADERGSNTFQYE